MALFAFLLFAALGGTGVVALRERPKPAAALGLLATGACLLAAVAMPQDASLSIGSTTLKADGYVRLFLVAAPFALLVSQVVGLAHGWQRELPLATLGALGLVGVALTVGTPAAAMLTVAAAGTFVVIASLERAISMPAVRAAAAGFRLAVVAGFMGLVAMAITGDDPIFVAPDVLAGATLLMAAAVGIRVGAVPAHAPVARLIERARTAALPLLAAWVPAAFAVVALGWTATIVALGATTPIVLVVVAFGVLTIALASSVVLIDDDLVRWLGYGVIADGGFVLLALAGDRPTAISAGLAWLVCFALARSIMACVVLGFQGAFDARRTRELEGWLRRMPLLGLALLAALIVGYGLPGTLTWQVRLDLAQGALGEPLGTALVAVALLPLVPMARLAWNGIRPQGAVVAAGGSERFTLPPRTEDAALAPRPEAADQGTPVALDAAAWMPRPWIPPSRSTPKPRPPSPQLPKRRARWARRCRRSRCRSWRPKAPGPRATSAGARPPAPTRLWGAAEAEAHDRDAPEPDAPSGRARTCGCRARPRGCRAHAPAPDPSGDQVPRDIEPSPEAGSTLSRRGRAARAARATGQPTVMEPSRVEAEGSSRAETAVAGSTDAEGATHATDERAAPSASPRAARRPSTMAAMRRAGSTASTSLGPIRHALRDLPAIWALDRTLVASLATLLLALVGLAYATDLVGLGVAAGFSVAGSSAP